MKYQTLSYLPLKRFFVGLHSRYLKNKRTINQIVLSCRQRNKGTIDILVCCSIRSERITKERSSPVSCRRISNSLLVLWKRSFNILLALSWAKALACMWHQPKGSLTNNRPAPRPPRDDTDIAIDHAPWLQAAGLDSQRTFGSYHLEVGRRTCIEQQKKSQPQQPA